MGREVREEDHKTILLELEAAELEAEALAEEGGLRIADPESGEEAPAAESLDDESLSLEDLRDKGDVDALLARAKALRTGDGVERDLTECLAYYRAAGECGSPLGKFSEALFYLSGAVVAEDASAGMGKLRAAAQAGSLRAKVYLGNAYELGVGRDPEPDKADVWYRSAARAAAIEHDPEEDADAYTLAMADLGCIRHARSLLRDESIPKKDRYAYLAKAKALGWALHQRNKQRASMEQEAIAREIAEAMEPPPEEKAAEEAKAEKKEAAGKEAEEEAKKPRIGPSKPNMSERMTAFAIALVLIGMGFGAGEFGTELGKKMLSEGQSIPVFGVHYGYILPAAIAASLLPVSLVYQWSSIALSTVAGLALGFMGWTIWKSPAGDLFSERLFQCHIFGVVGLVVALLAIGLLGGTRRRRWSK